MNSLHKNAATQIIMQKYSFCYMYITINKKLFNNSKIILPETTSKWFAFLQSLNLLYIEKFNFLYGQLLKKNSILHAIFINCVAIYRILMSLIIIFKNYFFKNLSCVQYGRKYLTQLHLKLSKLFRFFFQIFHNKIMVSSIKKANNEKEDKFNR